jgi:hypothetical protein
MSCCSIYNKPFLFDANQTSCTIQTNLISQFISPYTPADSGIWKPIVIKLDKSTLTYADILIQPDSTLSTSFDPCNCNPNIIADYNEIINTPEINCNYCESMTPTPHVKPWKLKDTAGNVAKVSSDTGMVDRVLQATCCEGACDTRMKYDDFLPKIPVLNQQYLTKFYDFKYHNQFPSCTNPSLGFSQFIKFNNTSLASFDGNHPELVIDWEIKDRISEIPYDKLTSQYKNIDDHNKAYARSLQTSQTCGNFILTQINPSYSGINPYYPIFSGLICDPDQTLVSDNLSDLLPSSGDFNIVPYGFSRNTYNNIFVKTQKLGSHWKWNYTSGILGWYRHYNINAVDSRPIQGVDLYIAPGDVFYATNDGPEPTPVANPDNPDIKACPSGLKLLSGNTVTGIIPSGSNFTYISSNLYDTFTNIIHRLDASNTSLNKKQLFELAALLCTAPQYDEVTVDLLKRSSYNYSINNLQQISLLNQHMSTSKIGSINEMNFIKSSGDLINTLANKYGSYLWFPPDSSTELILSDTINAQAYIDVSFDMNVKLSDTKNLGSCSVTTDCSTNNPTKKFSYNQTISLSNLKIESRIDTRTRYDAQCTAGQQTSYKSARMAGIYLNDNLIKETIYSSGCVIFQDNYPRISIVDGNNPTTQFCSACGPDSSYRLAINKLGNEDICWYYQNDNSFCDHTLARYYNNNELGNVVGGRPARDILDGTLYFERKYNATAFNSRIDKAAFHFQGGAYYDSNPFGVDKSTVFVNQTQLTSGKAGVKFDNRDVGIKLYNFKVEKLRSQNADTYACNSFPNRNPCQCFSINTIPEYPYICSTSSSVVFTNQPTLYTPALSTTYSPSIKAYGGYSTNELNKIIQSYIPNHPAAGSYLPTVNKQIDPINPYGYEQSITISLPNYVYTNWSFSLPSYTTNHADVWAEVLENVDLFKPTDFVEIQLDDNFWEEASKPNLGYQRFATEAIINNISIYDQQKKKIASKGDGDVTSISASLRNPYLVGLIFSDYVLYPPSGLCSSKQIYGTRGDESVLVPIKFTKIPRKQLLHFAIPSPEPMGYLKKGQFHPNSGLRYTSNNLLTPITYDQNNLTRYIDYDKELFGGEDHAGTILVGTVNDRFTKVLNQINNFDNHRKPKLYLKIQGKWYYYNAPNLLGFIKDNKLFIGEPNLFEYTKDDKTSKFLGPILPTAPKEHINFRYMYNFLPLGVDNSLIYNSDSYPITNILLTRNPTASKYNIATIDGTRAYFSIVEKNNSVFSLSSSIPSISQDEADSISTSRPYLVLTNGEIWKYKGTKYPNKFNISSYFLSDYNYYYTNFSDLNVDYTKINEDGYVSNTKKVCNQKVLLVNTANIRQLQTVNIIEKSIYAIKVDKNGNKIKFTDKLTKPYYKFYTKLKFDTRLKYEKNYLNTAYSTTSVNNGTDSLIIYQDSPYTKNERDSILYNSVYQTKWGDMLRFDGKIDEELSNSRDITQIYPSSLYDNNFYKIIVNNTNTGLYNYNINGINIIYTGIINYVIHQRYNIGINNNNTALVDNVYSYQNYLPFMDINFIPPPGEENNGITSSLVSAISNNGIDYISKINTGNLKISGIHQNFDGFHKWENNFIDPDSLASGLFWINLPSGPILKSALTIQPDKVLYSNTLRIDDPPIQLYSVNFTSAQSATACSRTFSPVVARNNTTFASNILDFSHFNQTSFNEKPFARFPIYCDTNPNFIQECSNDKCGINTAGAVAFSGQYLIQKEQSIKIPSDQDDIPYILSYDAGIYNTIGNNKLQYIQRIELDPNNVLYPQTSCDDSTELRPASVRKSVLNEEYQKVLSENIVDDHSSLVKNTDMLANEMLFRLLYGEKQKINLASIDGYNNAITVTDLMKYSDPKIEAKDVYRNIPYDLDTTADSSNRKISGSLYIKGILRVGKRVSVTIGSTDIIFTIARVSGQILLQVYCNGKTTATIIHSEITKSSSIVVSNGPASPPDQYTTFKEVKICKELQQYSISPISAFTSLTIENQPLCDGSRGPLTFPYFKTPSTQDKLLIAQLQQQEQALRTQGRHSEADAIQAQIANITLQGCHKNGTLFGSCNPDADNIPEGALINMPGCAPSTLPYTLCTNRGVVDDIQDLVSADCTLISKTSNRIELGGVARGVFGGCYVDGAIQNRNIIDGSAQAEVLAGGIIIQDVRGIPNNISSTPPQCGTCYTLDYKSPLTGNNKYSVFGGGDHPPSPGSLSENCEYANWDYGYCTNSNNSSCLCHTLQYDYSEFDYSFEYCRYSMSLKGHRRKIRHTDINNDGIEIRSGCTNPSDGKTRSSGPGDGGHGVEVCAYVSCPAAPPAEWHIYESESRVPSTAYVTNCATELCNISYDNNLITINIPGTPLTSDDKVPICIENSIRNNCPKVIVTAPDNSFTVVDSISSSCDNCGVDPNKIVMPEQNQNYETITSTRTCVLGYILSSVSPNVQVKSMSSYSEGCGYCSICPSSQNCRDDYTTSGFGQCGKNAPDSFPWKVCITYGNNDICNGGNTRSSGPSVAGCDIPIGFPISADAPANLIIGKWKKEMIQKHANTSPCFNMSYSSNDIIEGIIPGSCSDVKYATVTYPAIQFRQTLDGPTLSNTSVSYTVAYYTYSYKRPKTIQDILKGQDTIENCERVTSLCPNSPVNLIEKFKNDICQNLPICYDNKANLCADDNYCCRTGKPNYE